MRAILPALLLALFLPLGLLSMPASGEAPPPDATAGESSPHFREVPVPEDPRLRIVATETSLGIGRDLASTVAGDWERIEGMLGIRSRDPLEIRVGHGREEFAALQPPGVRVPGWAAGVAYARLGLVVLDAQASARGGSARGVLVHELAHIALGRLAEGGVPRWFNEGFALHAAGEWSLSRSATVARATLARALIPLSELETGWPHSLTDVDLAYAQGASMVSHLLTVESGAPFRAMIRELAEGKPFADAVRSAYGAPLLVLEIEWKGALTRRYGWLPLLVGEEILWGAAAMLLVLGGWSRRRRARRRMEEMEDEPPPFEDETEEGPTGEGPFEAGAEKPPTDLH